jgi:hypothetical protein
MGMQLVRVQQELQNARENAAAQSSAAASAAVQAAAKATERELRLKKAEDTLARVGSFLLFYVRVCFNFEMCICKSSAVTPEVMVGEILKARPRLRYDS